MDMYTVILALAVEQMSRQQQADKQLPSADLRCSRGQAVHPQLRLLQTEAVQASTCGSFFVVYAQQC
jgi:hypothetical protein